MMRPSMITKPDRHWVESPTKVTLVSRVARLFADNGCGAVTVSAHAVAITAVATMTIRARGLGMHMRRSVLKDAPYLSVGGSGLSHGK